MNFDPRTSRRAFLKQAAWAGVGAASLPWATAAAQRKTPAQLPAQPAWYLRTLRWGQTNIAERDAAQYDIRWWKEYWRTTSVQGIIVNAGGIVAYYPSRFPLHRRAQFLGDRDLVAELLKAARSQGLVFVARMDSGGAAEEFYAAHPDWFAVDAEGKPYRARGLYVPCINGPYYQEYIPGLLQEIAERFKPDGFTDNSWSGLGRDSICYCSHCAAQFRERFQQDLPRRRDWDSPAFRHWIEWSYARRLDIWDLNNRTTRLAGGPDCLWIGMNSGSIAGQCQSFRDYKEICARAQLIFLDHQSRSETSGFQQNAQTGKLIHGLLGWDKLIPESTALYQAGRPTFRLSAKPATEVKLWMAEAFAGGIQPWWHHVGANQEDRRAFDTVETLMRWHAGNQEFLVNRVPLASVAVVWSQRHTDFYGREDADLLVEQPLRGMTQALTRARIPYLPLHVDHIERDASKFAALVLPNLAVLSDAQAAAIRRFVQQGGALLATGETSLCNEWGERRDDYALADVFGAHATHTGSAATDPERRRALAQSQQTYLRLMPEPLNEQTGRPSRKHRHAILDGFRGTQILPYGGTLESLRTEPRAEVLLTFVPPFPVYPPEAVWMREPKTSIPGLIVQLDMPGRVAFLPADVDRRFARDGLPDQGDLLANLVRWAAADSIPLALEGTGLVDCHLYQQLGRLIVHLVNLTGADSWRGPVEQPIPIGPLRVSVKLPKGRRTGEMRALVSGKYLAGALKDGWLTFELKSILHFEVVVIG